MKGWIGVGLVMMSATAMAGNCTGNTVSAILLAPGASLAGNTICATSPDTSEQWQEFHGGDAVNGGDIVEYAQGSGDAIDPTRTVGTWSADAVSVSYSYTDDASSPYTFELWQSGSTLFYCQSGAGNNGVVANVNAVLSGSNQACP